MYKSFIHRKVNGGTQNKTHKNQPRMSLTVASQRRLNLSENFSAAGKLNTRQMRTADYKRVCVSASVEWE